MISYAMVIFIMARLILILFFVAWRVIFLEALLHIRPYFLLRAMQAFHAFPSLLNIFLVRCLELAS